MKQVKALGMVVGLALTAQFASAALILEYKFNETGTAAPSTGTDATAVTMRNSGDTPTDLHGAAGSGVSGGAFDRAFDNTASTGMGSPTGLETGGYANQADNNAIDSLQSITLQGWYYSAVLPGDGARLFSKQASAFDLYTDNTTVNPGRWGFYLNSNVALGTNGDYADLNTWVFFAVTYDGSAVNFYKGTTNSAVALVGSQAFFVGTIANNTAGLTIGNYADTSIQRPFDGLLDNMRIFGATTGTSGALDLAALEAIRLNDLIPPQVPEPSMVFLFAAGGALLWVRRYAGK